MQAEINILFWTECFYFFSQKFTLCGQMINGTAKFYKKKISIFSCFLIRGSHLFSKIKSKKQKEF